MSSANELIFLCKWENREIGTHTLAMTLLTKKKSDCKSESDFSFLPNQDYQVNN